MSTRDVAIQINADFSSLLGYEAEVINVGSHDNAGDADTVTAGLLKIHRNLQLLMARSAGSNS